MMLNASHVRDNTMNCWHCNTELIWGGDSDIEEDEDEYYTIQTNLSCPNPQCGAEVLVYLPKDNNNNEPT